MGGKPIIVTENTSKIHLKWMYFNEIHSVFLPDGTSIQTAQKLADFLYLLRPENHFIIEEKQNSQKNHSACFWQRLVVLLSRNKKVCNNKYV